MFCLPLEGLFVSIASSTAASPKVSSAPAAKKKPVFRPEIQGLRSLAVLMVVTYHVWFNRVSGGVDVFLLISAFLMTLQFTERHNRGEPFALLKHWLHLFRRLLPAAVTVIVATLAASYLFLPPTRWLDVIEQGWAALFYVENRLLQEKAVDYYANDHSLGGPLQHFWSLSIQGQVFILWPVIFVIAAWAAKRSGLSYRTLLAYVFSAIFAASLAYSIYFTATNQVQAYFDTEARLWEFALGTLVALVLPSLRFRRMTRVLMGWVGLIAMLSCGILLNVQAAFPGIAALWPTLAAALIIAAGQTGSTAGVDRFLSSRPLVQLGNISYALYLWHWPVLVIALAWSGKDHAGWLSGSVIILVSLVLAQLTTRFVEKPWRSWTWPDTGRRQAVLAILLVLSMAAAPLTFWRHQLNEQARQIQAQAAKNNPGARVLHPDFVGHPPVDNAVLLPAEADLSQDWASLEQPCSSEVFREAEELREMCRKQSFSKSPSRTILILGDSHAQQWTAALIPAAAAGNWSLSWMLKGGCKAVPAGMAPNPECEAFNAEVKTEVSHQQPDAIVLVGTAAAPSSAEEVLTPGLEELVEPWLESGIEVLVLRDNPRFSFNMAECVMHEGPQAPACLPPAENHLPGESPFEALAARERPGLHFLDMTDRICTETACPGAIGNVFVYLDDNHLSSTYVASMAAEFGQRLRAVTGWK